MKKPARANFVLIIKITDIKWKEIPQKLIQQSRFYDNIYDGNSQKK